MAELKFFYNRDFNSNANNFVTWSNSVMRFVGMQLPGELSLNYVNFPINVRWTNSTVTLTLSVSLGIYSLVYPGTDSNAYLSLRLENSLFYTRTITCNSSNATAKTFWVAASSKSKTQILSNGAWYIGILPILSGETATSQMQINFLGAASGFLGQNNLGIVGRSGFYGGAFSASSNSSVDIPYEIGIATSVLNQAGQFISPIPIIITS